MLGRVYIIQSPNTDEVYVGSTTETLKERFRRHIHPSNEISSKIIIDEGDATIELLEEIKVIDKDELRFYEQQYIELYKDIAVNEVCAFGIDRKERSKKRYEEKKDEILEKNKEYFKKNKEKISKKQSQRIECPCGGIVRKSGISEHNKSQKHQKFLIDGIAKNKSIVCPCGGRYTHIHKVSHSKSKKHQKYLENVDQDKDESAET
jgi:hypothetical protein